MKISKINSKIEEIFKSLFAVKKHINDSDFYRLIEDYQSSYKSQEYRISVVGEFSSGKSTFLNALIGCNILPHAKSETTATITYIHNVPERDINQNMAYVHFADNKSSSIKLDLSKDHSKLDKYIRVNEELDVAHKISHVDIYIHFANIQDNIVFVDTPGMNGVADGHRDLTLNEIQHSNASICLFHLKGIGKTDLNFIKELMKYQDKFYFILNGIDDLKLSEGETYETRLKTFREELSRSLPQLSRQNMSVYGVSALNALVSRDKSIKRLYENDKTNLTDDDRKNCWMRSKFDVFEKDLYSFLESDEKSNHFYLSLLTKLSSLLSDKIESLSTSLQINKASLEACPEQKALIKMRDTLSEKIERLIKDIENHLGSRMSDLELEARNMMRNDVQSEINTLNDVVTNLNYNNINQFIENRTLAKCLETYYGKITHELSSFIDSKSAVVYNELISKMSNAMPHIAFKNSKIKVLSGSSFDDLDARFESSTRINRLQDKIEHFNKQIKDNDKNIQKAYQSQTAIRQTENELKQAERERNQKIANMGSRPSVKWKEETYYRPRRGLFSIFTNACLGMKKDTRMVKDDSQAREWDKQMSNIKCNTDKKISYLKACLDKLEDSAPDTQYYEQLRKQLIKEKERAEQDLQRSLEQNRREMEVARTSAIKNKKKEMIKDIESNLNTKNGAIYTILLDGILRYTADTQKSIMKYIYEIYNSKKKEFMGQLNDLINKKEDGSNGNIRQKTNELTSQIKSIQTILGKVNELIK